MTCSLLSETDAAVSCKSVLEAVIQKYFDDRLQDQYVAWDQCWRKLLLKVMHYNIALLTKKVTNYVT